MWFIKIISVIAQILVILLAGFLVSQFSFKQFSESRFKSLEEKLTARIDQDRQYLNDKIITVSDNVNRYQTNREERAKLYGQRIDELYALYKENPEPILKASELVVSKPREKSDEVKDDGSAKKLLDANLKYTESRINKIAEQLDNNWNEGKSRLEVLDARIRVLESENRALKTQPRIMNTNNNLNNVNVNGR